MAQENIRAEFGAWVEGTQPKKSNPAQMRKVWVSPAPKGERAKLAVIRTTERGDVHMLSLDVSTPEFAADAYNALSLALNALSDVPALAKAQAPAKAPAPAPEKPRGSTTRNVLGQPVAPKAQTRNPAPKAPAPAKSAPALDWFASLMSEAGA